MTLRLTCLAQVESRVRSVNFRNGSDIIWGTSRYKAPTCCKLGQAWAVLEGSTLEDFTSYFPMSVTDTVHCLACVNLYSSVKLWV